jgi:TctA family transporter
MLRMPYSVLLLATVTFSATGAFRVNNTQISPLVLAVSGIAGFILLKLECELTPFILGFIFGPMTKDHLRRSLVISGGAPTIFMTHPISAGLLASAIIVLVILMASSVGVSAAKYSGIHRGGR